MKNRLRRNQRRHKAECADEKERNYGDDAKALIFNIQPYETGIVTHGANGWPLLVCKHRKPTSPPDSADTSDNATEPSSMGKTSGKKTQDSGSGPTKSTKADDTKGTSLSMLLEERLGALVEEGKERADCIAMMAEEASIDEATVNQIVAGEIECPSKEVLDGFATALGVAVEDLVAAASADGCSFEVSDDMEDDKGDDTKMDDEEKAVEGKAEADEPPIPDDESSSDSAQGITGPVKEDVLNKARALLDCVTSFVAQVEALPVVEQVDATEADEAWGVPWRHKELPPAVAAEYTKLQALLASIDCYIPWSMSMKHALDPQVATAQDLAKLLGAGEDGALDEETAAHAQKALGLLGELLSSGDEGDDEGSSDDEPEAPASEEEASAASSTKTKSADPEPPAPDSIQPSNSTPTEPSGAGEGRQKVNPFKRLKQKQAEKRKKKQKRTK